MEKPVKTIKEFCFAYDISHAHWYRMCKKGETPKTIKMGRRVLIPIEAELEWRRSCLAQ